MTKVAILIPFGEGGRPSELNRRIGLMQVQFPQHEFSFVEIDLMIIGKARNMLLETAMSGTEAEVFWFIDRDTFPPPHAGVLVDQAMELGIVSGLYFSRRMPYTPQAYLRAMEENAQGMYWPLLEYPSAGLMVVDAVGGGCLCIRRDVLENISQHHQKKTEESLELVRNRLTEAESLAAFEYLVEYSKSLSPWFEFLDKKGEDLYFCERARDAGHVIWLNVEVKCSHQGEMEFVEEHFIHLRDSGALQIVPVGTPGADELQVHGAEDEDESTNIPYPRPESVERGNDISRGARRVGELYSLPGPQSSP
jgi:hypothetical protein